MKEESQKVVKLSEEDMKKVREAELEYEKGVAFTPEQVLENCRKQVATWTKRPSQSA